MDGLDYWRLCDELSVIQAALLIAGCEPTSDAQYRAEKFTDKKPTGYEAALTAISNALRRGAITGKCIPLYEYDMNSNICGEVAHSVDIYTSRIEVDSLRAWLSKRGLKTGFFFPELTFSQEYLNPKHPRYAPKLAAAIFAWLATDGECATKGKSPKQALTKWLRENAREFGLTDDDGKPNETGIEEAAKVANWQLTGGAPKTPVG
ncbi:hypothetical protein [Methylocapsa acidiphila]|uniref:hypothetical protein n=1 Tax=Methylocapsa acidiphila TaxID=133552 RepID=UPI0012EC166D|nr:hypothetical protein [Methylocapsa acidiphila]